MANEATMSALTTAPKEITNNESNTKQQMSPIERKNNILEDWTSEMELWDDSKNILQYTKNYLILMENIRKTGEQDPKRTDKVEMMKNQEFDKKKKTGRGGLLRSLERVCK